MAINSTISWTEASWNPITGCTKHSEGCKNCYAEIMTRRLQAMGVPAYSAGFNAVRTHPQLLDIPHQWKRPKMIFVNSMSDIFHKDIPEKFIQEVFRIMRETPRHTYQVLTKRSKRLLEMDGNIEWPENVWMGVTVESNRYIHRIDNLRQTGAKLKFISAEPLLTPLPGLNLNGVDWVIVGGESGPGWRPMDEKWVMDIRDQCLAANVPFFFKQHSGFSKKKVGCILEGQVWKNIPA